MLGLSTDRAIRFLLRCEWPLEAGKILYWLERLGVKINLQPRYSWKQVQTDQTYQEARANWPDQVQHYLTFSDANKAFWPYTALFYFLLVLKNSAFILYTMHVWMYGELEEEAEVGAGSGARPQLRLNCVRTNCSQLRAGELDSTETLKRLPMFTICFPSLRAYYSPISHNSTLGVLNQALILSGVFMLACLYPIYHSRVNYTAPSIMFALAPQVERDHTRQEIQRWLEATLSSLINFKVSRLQLHLAGSGPNRKLGATAQSSSSATRPSSATRRKGLLSVAWHKQPLKSQQVSGLASRLVLDMLQWRPREADQFRAYVQDCMPLNRRLDWWHERSNKLHCLVALASFSFLVSAVWFVESWATRACRAHNRLLYDRIQAHLQASDCAIWTEFDQKLLDFDSLLELHNWSWLGLVEQVAVFALPLYSISLSLAHCFLLICELRLVLVQVEQQALILRDYGDIKERLQLVEPSSPAAADKQTFDELQELIKNRFSLEQISSDWTRYRIRFPYGQASWHESNNSLASGRERQELVFDLLQRYGKSDEVQAEMMEKFQLTYRLFVQQFKKNDSMISTMMQLAYVLNYSLTLIAVFFYRKVGSLVSESLLLITLNMVTICFFVCLASSLHTGARRVEPIFHLLLAQCNHSTNERILLMQSIWMKQLGIIETEGGVALKTFGIKITYTNVIQLLLLTSTMLLFAYQK